MNKVFAILILVLCSASYFPKHASAQLSSYLAVDAMIDYDDITDEQLLKAQKLKVLWYLDDVYSQAARKMVLEPAVPESKINDFIRLSAQHKNTSAVLNKAEESIQKLVDKYVKSSDFLDEYYKKFNEVTLLVPSVSKDGALQVLVEFYYAHNIVLKRANDDPVLASVLLANEKIAKNKTLQLFETLRCNGIGEDSIHDQIFFYPRSLF